MTRPLALVILLTLIGCNANPVAPPPPLSDQGGTGGGGTGGGGTGGGTGGGGTDATTGQVLFWMASDLGQIDVRVGATVGRITSYYPNGVPSCGAAGSVTLTLPVGTDGGYSASCVERDPLTGQSANSWLGLFDVVPGGCVKIQLTAQTRCGGTGGTGPGGGSGGGGSGGGGSGGGGSQVGTVVTRCLTSVQRVSASQAAWVSMPAPFSGLDFKIYYSNAFGVYEVIWRNRYSSAMYFNFQPSTGTPAQVTTYRNSLASGREDSPPGITVQGLVDGGTGCVRVDRVRFGTDSGAFE